VQSGNPWRNSLCRRHRWRG